jgi:hypothetical protein
VNLAPGIWARDTPLKIGYGDLKAGEDPMKNNNCAFRAIYSQVAKNRQKWFKQQFPLKTIRKEFGLPPNCKISPDELFMICDAKGVELTIIVVRGMDPETAEISIKSTQATGHVEPMIRVILHADTEHYYCPATGKSPDNHTTDYCGVCGEAVKLKDFLKHEYIHKIRHEFKSTLELPTGLLSRGDDESMKDYSKRHREFFVNIIIEF